MTKNDAKKLKPGYILTQVSDVVTCNRSGEVTAVSSNAVSVRWFKGGASELPIDSDWAEFSARRDSARRD